MKALPAALGLFLASFALQLTGCQNTAAEENREEVRRIVAAHEKYMLEFKLAQEKFRAENPMPQRLDFAEHGTLVLRECVIVGRPGSELMRLDYTFLNETGHRLKRAQATLILVNEDAQMEHSQVHEIALPFGLSFSNDSTYSSYFDMPLEDVHRAFRWSWRVELESEIVTR